MQRYLPRFYHCILGFYRSTSRTPPAPYTLLRTVQTDTFPILPRCLWAPRSRSLSVEPTSESDAPAVVTAVSSHSASCRTSRYSPKPLTPLANSSFTARWLLGIVRTFEGVSRWMRWRLVKWLTIRRDGMLRSLCSLRTRIFSLPLVWIDQ
jgi:hypothetical protein